MRLFWLALAVSTTFLTGCGDIDVADEAEPQLGEQVIDLRIDDAVKKVVASQAESTVVVRRNGTIETFGTWRKRVTDVHGITFGEGEEPAEYFVIPDPNDRMDEAEALRRMAEGNVTGACPAGCSHCPEDYGYLCFALCM